MVRRPTSLRPSKRVEEELANPESTTAVNPINLAETREMASKYIKEPEDMKKTGDGTRWSYLC
jgi:hypothetical protein